MFAFDLPPPAPRRSGRAAVLLLLLPLALTACRDTADPGAPLGPSSAPSFSLSRAPSDSDSGIDPRDTHLTMEVVLDGSTTISSPVLITDPVTGVQSHEWTIAHERETMRIETGYDYYGREVQDLRETTTMGDPGVQAINTTRRTWNVGDDDLVRYDAQGGVVPNAPRGGCPECVLPVRTPQAPSGVQITDGVVLDAAAIDALPALSATAAPLARVAGPEARVERVAADRIRIINDLSRGPTIPGAAAAAGAQPERGEYVRSYRRSGQHYLLDGTELTAEYPGKDGARTRMQQHEQIRILRLYQNPVKDRERAALRERLGIEPLVPQSFDWSFEPMRPEPPVCPTGESFGPECVGPGGPPPPPPPASCEPVPDGTNVLFQHGIMSTGGTWERMDRDWVCSYFKTNRIERPSINWFPKIDTQRDELRGKVPTNMQQIVLVGHSNGGLVSRAYAQWAQTNQPGRVKGVVTLDSPNQGAIIAINAKALEYIVGTATFGFSWILADFLFWHPFYEDDVPGSAFLQRTNTFGESFTRVGVQTHTPKRWVLWRVLSSGSCYPEHASCGERAVARRTQESYDRARHYSKFWYRPWQSIPAGLKMMWMNGKDAAWNGVTAPFGLASDGFIHGPGQVYPRAQRNRLIQNGDSHVGTTRSPYVWTELKDALQREFGLAVRNP